ncbi:MAG: hypothetical protein ACP5UH_00880 [Candidatus Micrarchaeia archaeon]
MSIGMLAMLHMPQSYMTNETIKSMMLAALLLTIACIAVISLAIT